LWATGIVTGPVWVALGGRESDLPPPTKIVVKPAPETGVPTQVEVAAPPWIKVTNAAAGAVTVLLYLGGWTNLSAVVGLLNVADIAARQLSRDYAKATEPLMGVRGHW
jgi:hypothetical protein